MSHSELIPEIPDPPPTVEPPSAYLRGRRRISLDPYGVPPPLPTNEPKDGVLDDFGLPVTRRSKSRRSISVDDKSQDVGQPAPDVGQPAPDGGEPTLPKRRSVSEQSHESSPRSSRFSTAPASPSERNAAEHGGEEEKDGLESIPQLQKPAIRHGRSKSSPTPSSDGQTLEPPSAPGNGPASRSPSRPRAQTSALPRISEKEIFSPRGGVSEWSHQVLAPKIPGPEAETEEDVWQAMPALGKFDLYDDQGQLLARGAQDSEDEKDVYAGLGGAGKGYTRVHIDDDAKSTTSMDENTSYLFKEKGTTVVDEDEDQRDPLAQMQATKDMLTEGQRIAYVGVTRLAMAEMAKTLDDAPPNKLVKKEWTLAVESLKKWGQKMMVRLYGHMDIDSSEQVMIEQLAEHGVQPSDLTPALMRNARVKNPMARPSSNLASPNPEANGRSTRASSIAGQEPDSPPPYEIHENQDLPEVRSPGMLPQTRSIDIDLRWTVLCDLFLVLIADSIYDARSRVLLEIVGAAMDVKWLDVCRFEKRVTDALEMQEAAVRENWDEAEHMESRRKMALRRKYMMMGIATVGGSLVIGLSAGLLAPVIGAGLAAGFTTIGVAGTSGFLAGAGGTALITTGAVLSGGTIAVRASHRRMGAVKTFEYRPLHNNKRVSLIVTISGWMNGKVDDVRLPFSTIDPIMGDIYSVFWEPDMLQSMGDTIRILATEALTQGLQQVLASTILTALMASLTLPIILTKLSYLIDNPWSVSLDRADAAGLILADSLIERNLGARPITLVGFSLGSRVIFSCLRELASRGGLGLVQNVYLFGCPVVAKKEEFLRARSIISGRFVNGYATNDWILGYLFRATNGGISRIAGLATVEEVSGLENVDVTDYVNGHMAYRAAMPRLLREVGWEVESDEFTEIEDPDPENHEARQRELIREIEEARKDATENPRTKRFGFFKRGKPAAKRTWETYDERNKEPTTSTGAASQADRRQSRILFDIDAIRAELESEHMEVKQLESTLGPMKLDLNALRAKTVSIPQIAFVPVRTAKSADDLYKNRHEITSPTNIHNGISFHDNDHHEFDGSSHGENATLSFEPNPPLPSAVLAWQGQAIGHDPVTPLRPELRGSLTSPVGSRAIHLEHNAWADEEDEDFGKEKEVTMSFG